MKKQATSVICDQQNSKNIQKAVQNFIDKESAVLNQKSEKAKVNKYGIVNCLEYNDTLKATILKKHNFNSKDI